MDERSFEPTRCILNQAVWAERPRCALAGAKLEIVKKEDATAKIVAELEDVSFTGLRGEPETPAVIVCLGVNGAKADADEEASLPSTEGGFDDLVLEFDQKADAQALMAALESAINALVAPNDLNMDESSDSEPEADEEEDLPGAMAAAANLE